MESLPRVSAMMDSTRELTLEAAASARTINTRPSNKDLSFLHVKKLLDSRNDREILDGLRKVISMMYRSMPCLPFFSSVVKNIASPNIEIKKPVYIYLLHYAESEPDLALLSINTIQKSLTDQNPQVRAMALRVMSGIRVPVISQIVSLAIKRGMADMSPHVRKAAALAIPKCYRLDPNTLPQLIEYISTLLGDKQYFVVGPAVVAFLEVCPEEINLIHKHYRSLVRKLVDMDEWSQLAMLRLMTFYARKCFPRRTARVKQNKNEGFYEDDVVDEGDGAAGKEVQVLDPDLEMFLKACKPLLSSRNSAVIVAVARCFLHLEAEDKIDNAIGPLIALLRSPQDIQQIAMYNIVAVCLVRAQSFVRYANHFLNRATDTIDVSRLKFEVLTLIFPHCEFHMKGMILSELEHFTRASNPDLVQESVRAVGRCAQSDSNMTSRCLRLLLQQLSSQDENLVAESLTVIRHLIQRDPKSHVQTVIHLAVNLDTTTSPQARASIVWLVGEFAGLAEEENIAPDVLRILAKGFAKESEAAKLQIVLLAAKVYLHYLIRTVPQSEQKTPESNNAPSSANGKADDSFEKNSWQEETDSASRVNVNTPEHPIPLLWSYILQLVRYDTSYDLRDRTRMFQALLANPSSTQLASLMLFAPKPVPHTPSPSENRKGLLIGSSSLVIGTGATGIGGVLGYQDLPEWVAEGEEPDAKLRDEGAGKAEYTSRKDVPAAQELDRAVAAKRLPKTVAGGKDKSLDDWLAEKGEGEETDEGSSEPETETETETETDSETEEEEEEEGVEVEEETDEESGSEEGEEENDRLVR